MEESMLNDAPEREHLSESETVELVRRKLALRPVARSDRELDLIERVIRLEEGQKSLSEQMDKRFEHVDKRFEQLQIQIDKRFSGNRWAINTGVGLLLTVQSVILYFVR